MGMQESSRTAGLTDAIIVQSGQVRPIRIWEELLDFQHLSWGWGLVAELGEFRPVFSADALWLPARLEDIGTLVPISMENKT